MLDPRYGQAALAVHRTHSTKAGGGDGASVVRVSSANDDSTTGLTLERPIVPHHSQDRVVGLGARTGKKDLIQALWANVRQTLGQGDGRRVGALEEAVVVRKDFKLIGRRLDQLLASVPHGHAPKPRHTI